MRSTLFLAAATAAFAFLATTPASAVKDKTKIPKICAEAEERYREIFGKPTADEPVTVVLMYKYAFCPEKVTVKRGTTVRWVNMDKRTSHDVWFKEKGDEPKDRLFPEEHLEMTFDLPPGDYPYLCEPHWESDDMKGTVTVTE